jgi:hypothetical protein
MFFPPLSQCPVYSILIGCPPAATVLIIGCFTGAVLIDCPIAGTCLFIGSFAGAVLIVYYI